MCLKDRQAYMLASTVFGIVAVFHFLRIVRGWDAVIGGWIVPMWLSWLAVVIAGYLSWHLCPLRSSGKGKK